jgi:hypothetical protein
VWGLDCRVRVYAYDGRNTNLHTKVGCKQVEQDEKELLEDKKLFAKKAQELLDLKNELHALRKEHKLCPSMDEVTDGVPKP